MLHYLFCIRPPFEVMEVWLESLSMHLSVCMPIPSDLLFDIYHYRGLSPTSSGSTTPEGIPSECRSPNLQTIKEGKMQQTTMVDVPDGVRRNVSSENLKGEDIKSDKEIIKKSSYENIHDKDKLYSAIEKSLSKLNKTTDSSTDIEIKNDLRNDKTSDNKLSKSSSIDDSLQLANKNLNKKYVNTVNIHNSSRQDEPSTTTKNSSTNNSLVTLRKVPKNFTRNRFRHCQEVPEISNISRLSKLNVLPKYSPSKDGKVSISQTAQINQTNEREHTDRVPKLVSNLITNIPDIVSSCTIKKTAPNVNITRSNVTPSKLKLATNICSNSSSSSTAPSCSASLERRRLPDTSVGIHSKICDVKIPLNKTSASNNSNISNNSKSSSLVKNIVDTLNRNENKTAKPEGLYARRARNDVKNKTESSSRIRSSSPVESTAL